MAGFQKIYTSQNQYIEDIARSTGLFDDTYYEQAKQEDRAGEYISILATAKDNLSSTFNKAVYDRLSGQDRLNYFVTENLMDKSSDEYKQSRAYFDQQIKTIKNQEIYDSLNGFQKVINSIGGYVGNAILQLGGIIEGLVDVSAEIVGAVGYELGQKEFAERVKNFIAKDATGYGAAQTAMNDWINKYTFIDKNVVARGVNDIATGIVRMTPMIIGGALAPVTGGLSATIGTDIYYLAMAGNSAEEAIQVNPNINYGTLLLYTGATVGLEALTEWGSDKLFGADIVSSLMKGDKYAPTTGIVKTLLHNFGTEAGEEAVSELFGSMIYKALVDPSEDIASIGDIFYAALIGGLTGAVMTGGKILGTKRLSLLNGEIVETGSLTKEQRKSAQNLGLSKSWGLANLSQAVQQSLQSTDNVTELMSKYGTSLDDIKTQHAEEYQKALEMDIQTKTDQANLVLDLANLLSTIGVEQFKKSAELLNKNIESTQQMIDNYLNHTDEFNKAASAAYSANYPGETFTPIQTPTNSEQALATALRQAFPHLQVVFGTFGSEDGRAVRSVNVSKDATYLFVQSGLTDAQGYKAILGQTIRTELANDVLETLDGLDSKEADSLTHLLDMNKDYKDLSFAEKQTLAQIICFDPVNNRRIFQSGNKLHRQIFNYITDQSEYVKRFGRQTEVNKIRYHDLLEIRNMFLENIAETDASNEDINQVQKDYKLSDEEVKTKIIDKTTPTFLNYDMRMTNIKFAQNAILKTEAINELSSQRIGFDQTVDFDWSQLYNEAYYKEEWRNAIKTQQATEDFEAALKAHLYTAYQTEFDMVLKNDITTAVKEKLSEKQLRKTAEIILTREYLDTNPDLNSLQNKVADKLYYLLQQGRDIDINSDSVYIDGNMLKGTSQLSFINTQLFAKKKSTQTEIGMDVQDDTMTIDVSTPIQQVKNQSNIYQLMQNATTPKEIADVLITIIDSSPTAQSKRQGYEGTDTEYKQTSNDLVTKYASLFVGITQENYQRVRDEIARSNYKFAEEALTVFDRAMKIYSETSPKFDESTREKIANREARHQTLSAINQGLQSAALANRMSMSEYVTRMRDNGLKVEVSNEMVQKYVPELKNKQDYVNKLNEKINSLDEQLKKTTDFSNAAELNQELGQLVEERNVLSKGTNEEIMDWKLSKMDIVKDGYKIQKDLLQQLADKSELAKEQNKDLKIVLVDKQTGMAKPFPKATEKVLKFMKGAKSFRLWAMLSSPVTWVRNLVGNAGMTLLDRATNIVERQLYNTKLGGLKLDENAIQKLKTEQIELVKKEKLTSEEQARLDQINAQLNQAYEFKFVETKASKDLREKIFEQYKDVFNAIINGQDINKYATSAEKGADIARTKRDKVLKSQDAKMYQRIWSAMQFVTDWGLNTGIFGDNKVVLGSLIKNFANMVESNKTYLLESLTKEYGKDGRGMSTERKALVEQALQSKESMDIVNAISEDDFNLFMKSCKERTFQQYFKNSNWLSEWCTKLAEKKPILASVVSLVMPFPKVAANILNMAYKYSPLGFINAMKQWSVVKQMDKGVGIYNAFARGNAIRATAQAGVGSVMLIAGLMLSALGFIDIDDDDYLGPALNIMGVRMSLSNLAPSMTTFSVGAAMLWAWKNDQSAMLKALDVLYDNTLLGNIENVFRYSSPDKYVENLSINYFSQYVPAALKMFAKMFSNSATIDKTGNYFQKLFRTFLSGIPIVANLLPKKINPYTGEFLTSTGTHNILFNLIAAVSPLGLRYDEKTATQKEAERLGAQSTGLSGKFSVNGKDYEVDDKMKYAQYRATYINNNFEKILSGKQKVTVEDENGKRITTTYDKLNDTQKKNVLTRLYSEASNITKIKWWTDMGNSYVVTSKDLYNEYRSLFNSKNIIYKSIWSKSKFLES